MKNSARNIFASLLLALIFAGSWSVEAQPAKNARARIDMLKKMKLLDILNLKEEEADKFLVRYNTLESEIHAKEDVMNNASTALKDAMDKKASDKELQAKNDELVKSFKALQDAITNKMNSMKEILSTENYSKYLMFEMVFPKKLRKFLMGNFNKNRSGRFGGPKMDMTDPLSPDDDGE